MSRVATVGCSCGRGGVITEAPDGIDIPEGHATPAPVTEGAGTCDGKWEQRTVSETITVSGRCAGQGLTSRGRHGR
ncbi:hypothetical protein OG389_01095 [Streptomyces sp. NBC_00435]|uniref:hypothetical protein n=1 Tax=Streptomyces sp. NBC_00435 TaxID=2903649 RepID=UPI002E1D9A3D